MNPQIKIFSLRDYPKSCFSGEVSFPALGGCLKVPPISLECLRLRPLGGGEALKRKRAGVHRDGSRLCRELHGRPLCRDAINLVCAAHLICLLSETSHCRPVAAIVCGGGLKNLE